MTKRKIIGIGIVILALMIGGFFFATNKEETKLPSKEQETNQKHDKKEEALEDPLKDNQPGEMEQFTLKRDTNKAIIDGEIPDAYARFIEAAFSSHELKEDGQIHQPTIQILPGTTTFLEKKLYYFTVSDIPDIIYEICQEEDNFQLQSIIKDGCSFYSGVTYKDALVGNPKATDPSEELRTNENKKENQG